MPRRALEEPRPDIGFQQLDRLGRRRSRQADVRRRSGEAAPFNDTNEKLHAIETVHDVVHHSRILMSNRP
ncbi:hypothetical protein D3C72_2419760 [compost metagenome]